MADPGRRTTESRREISALLSPHVVAALAAVLLVVITVADRLVNADVVVLTVFLGLAPLLACAALRPRATAGFALAATVLTVMSGAWNGTGAQYAVRVANVVLVGSLSVLVSTVRAQREDDLLQSQQIATAAQEALLPVLPDLLGRIRVATRYHSATRSAQVGGDFFDFVRDARRTRLILGDISGKGIEAVTQAARAIRAFRQYAASEAQLLDVARRIDEYVRPYWAMDFYATAVLVEVVDDQTLAIVSAGHPPPLIVSAEVVTELPVAPCLPLGIGPADTVTTHQWQPGDRLLLYTDGLIEARDGSGRFLPRTSIDAILRSPGTLDDCLDAILAAVHSHAGKFGDDLALVLLQNGPAVPETLLGNPVT